METLNKIEDFKSKHKYVHLTRGRGDFQGTDRGYIIDYSSDFLLLQKTDDFVLNGYSVFPLDTIKRVRHNKYDKFYDKIMNWENLKEQIGTPYSLDLSTWQTIFRTLKKTKLTVTIECEEPHLDYFCIGTLQRIRTKEVDTLYFSPDGIIDENPTVTEYNNITKVSFDDRYANVFAKYVKPKT